MALHGKTKKFCVAFTTVFSIVAVVIALAFIPLKHYISFTDVTGYHTQDIIRLNLDVNNLNTLLCSQYSINSLFNDFDVYLLPSKAEISKNSTIDTTGWVENLDSKTDIKERGYRLLPGSTIKMSSCYSRGDTVETLVFKGDDNLEKWKSDRQCHSCVWKRAVVDSNTNCSLNTYVNLTADVTSLDNYHTVVARTSKGQKPYPLAYFTSYIPLSRAYYNVSGFTEMCRDKHPCTFNLTYNSQPDIILQFYLETDLTTASLYTTCELRVIFWVGTMCILPVSVLLIAAVLILCFIHVNRSNKSGIM